MTLDKDVPSGIDVIDLAGIPITAFTIDSLHASIKASVHAGAHHRYMHINMHGLDLSLRRPDFKNILRDADHVFCDGHGVMLAARLFGATIPQKITYAHWLPLLCGFCAEEDLSIYFLGGKPQVAEAAAVTMKNEHPELVIVGAGDGYFNKSTGCDENQMVIKAINAAKPDVLLVCFGMPLQESWIHENWKDLDVRVVLPAGAAIDYAAGVSVRPPRWMTDHGLEWLGRLCHEPFRLFYRYIVRMPIVFVKLLIIRLCRRSSSSRPGQAP